MRSFAGPFLLLHILIAVQAADLSHCVPGFAADPAAWDVCRSKICVLLLEEAPVSILLPSLSLLVFGRSF